LISLGRLVGLSWLFNWRFMAACCWRAVHLYFVIAFVFPALKMREQKYVYRSCFLADCS
jgi:hypothetical protein